MKQKVILVCTECLSRNYSITKNKRVNVERLELNKFCKKCGKQIRDGMLFCTNCGAKVTMPQAKVNNAPQEKATVPAPIQKEEPKEEA